MSNGATLTIVGTVEEPVSFGLRGGGMEQAQKVVDRAVSVETLQENFSSFVNSLRQVLSVDSGRVGDLELYEINFSVEIGVDGEFKLLGTGVGASASSSLSFTLRKQS